jgi:hypothetical protein
MTVNSYADAAPTQALTIISYSLAESMKILGPFKNQSVNKAVSKRI